ncbi:hypothetical protein EYF80_002640 [Liparis tanakae]|uniref:Uncharacterized protein n=1 Tax=Liparis tanakae TaxID=230148 RepID=A0A4Z2J944_9TELE|nr:hypothetical protein EYF80_002640 [Liparis tanakae]
MEFLTGQKPEERASKTVESWSLSANAFQILRDQAQAAGKLDASATLQMKAFLPPYLSSVPKFLREKLRVFAAEGPLADWMPTMSPPSVSVSMAKSLRTFSMLSLSLSKTIVASQPGQQTSSHEKLLPGGADLKLSLFPFHVVTEARVADLDVPERQGILGSLEVIQVTLPRIVHEPPRLVPPKRPLAGQFVQVPAQLGGLLLRCLDLGHIPRPGGRDPRRCARACFAAILLFVHLSPKCVRAADAHYCFHRMTACLYARAAWEM